MEDEVDKSQQCSNSKLSVNIQDTQSQDQDNKTEDSEMLKEIAIQSVDLNVATCSTEQSRSLNSCPIPGVSSRLPLIVISSPTESRAPITAQSLRTYSSLSSFISPLSLISGTSNQPKSLFIQALTKLTESSVSIAVVNQVTKMVELSGAAGKVIANYKSPELSPPDSLTSAPPSYSFVLRQTAAHRRPRLMGTFIPSPSFVQHTPPPNYAAAFDIYVDNPVHPQPQRVYSFGFTSMPVVCPECGYAGLTAVTSKITICTHICALILCLFCCWICAPLPYLMRSCKDVYHYCRNCRNYLGMYSPSNPESTFPA
ncbi:uncharacterized protein LOC126379560 [Pectinophora gossypiella]|uniref:uncharacterized protein LOC126379560 n=1 Tax=Pectinophora gossypiella TaxID=13191 RepID=UPI00214F1A10|nr:uncharacterized protein LOC126379560 [Pectinophora gossypiella]